MISHSRAKYPLAILAKLQEAFSGTKLIGYDIGCSFKKTAANSSIGDSLRANFIIPAMHGYAHNRACQLTHHPIYFDGAGLEDFETCERVFSASNECARTTRHATPFHRHQAIDLHFQQWDADKYEALGTFLYNNYKQALTIVVEVGDLLKQIQGTKGFLDTDFVTFLAEEKKYLDGLSAEPEVETLAVGYAEAVDKLAAAE